MAFASLQSTNHSFAKREPNTKTINWYKGGKARDRISVSKYNTVSNTVVVVVSRNKTRKRLYTLNAYSITVYIIDTKRNKIVTIRKREKKSEIPLYDDVSLERI